MAWLEDARKACGMTLIEAGHVIGKTHVSFINYQKDPLQLRLVDFVNLYHAVGTDSKQIMRKALEKELDSKK